MTDSSGDFLTTHTGSLPRPEALATLMFAQEEGVPIDGAARDAMIEAAVAVTVARQVESGIDIVNDGEMSKPSYATYIKDRLTGFDGESASYTFQDLVEFPRTAARVFADAGRSRRKAPACTSPITVKDMDAPRQDSERLTRLAAGRRQFMSAASPGVTSLFFSNDYYPDDESYLFAIADALKHEYETIAAAGITLQIDCPDLAMGRHVQYAHLDLPEFRRRIGLHVAALNHATAAIAPERLRMHLCWGNYPGPHHCDVPLADILDIVWTARPATILFEAANPRHAHEFALFETVRPPDGKVLAPGVIEPQSSYIEHPELVAQRIGRFAHLVGRERVIAGVDCGFSIHVGSGGPDHELVWAKLAALSEGARIASARFR